MDGGEAVAGTFRGGVCGAGARLPLPHKTPFPFGTYHSGYLPTRTCRGGRVRDDADTGCYDPSFLLSATFYLCLFLFLFIVFILSLLVVLVGLDFLFPTPLFPYLAPSPPPPSPYRPHRHHRCLRCRRCLRRRLRPQGGTPVKRRSTNS